MKSHESSPRSTLHSPRSTVGRDEKSPARQLIWISIVHTEADLGSVGGSVRDAYVRRFGKGRWDRHAKTINEMWRNIRHEIDRLSLDCKRVRLYQDGLPSCGREEEIVRDLARAGSQNHQLLLDLMAKGATLMGTESPELLVEEYELVRQIVASLSSGSVQRLTERQKALSQALLVRRDRYIAERIDATLQDGETGLLFLGMLHSLDGRPVPATGCPPGRVQLTRLLPASGRRVGTRPTAQRRPVG